MNANEIGEWSARGLTLQAGEHGFDAEGGPMTNLGPTLKHPRYYARIEASARMDLVPVGEGSGDAAYAAGGVPVYGVRVRRDRRRPSRVH